MSLFAKYFWAALSPASLAGTFTAWSVAAFFFWAGNITPTWKHAAIYFCAAVVARIIADRRDESRDE